MKKLKKFENFEFKEVEKSKRNKLFIVLKFMGGDASYFKEVPIELKGIKFCEFKNHLPEINKEVEKYEIFAQVIDAMSNSRSPRDYTKFIATDPSQVPKGGFLCNIPKDEVIKFFDHYAPIDAFSDGEFLCSLTNIFLIGYDEDGNKHRAQAKRL